MDHHLPHGERKKWIKSWEKLLHHLGWHAQKMWENWRKFNHSLIIKVSLLWQQARIEVPVVLPANIFEFCPELRVELWFMGALHANCIKAAQAAGRTRHWVWPHQTTLLKSRMHNLIRSLWKPGSGCLEGRRNCLHLSPHPPRAAVGLLNRGETASRRVLKPDGTVTATAGMGTGKAAVEHNQSFPVTLSEVPRENTSAQKPLPLMTSCVIQGSEGSGGCQSHRAPWELHTPNKFYHLILLTERGTYQLE